MSPRDFVRGEFCPRRILSGAFCQEGFCPHMSKRKGHQVMGNSSLPVEFQLPDGKTPSKLHKDVIN